MGVGRTPLEHFYKRVRTYVIQKKFIFKLAKQFRAFVKFKVYKQFTKFVLLLFILPSKTGTVKKYTPRNHPLPPGSMEEKVLGLAWPRGAEGATTSNLELNSVPSQAHYNEHVRSPGVEPGTI